MKKNLAYQRRNRAQNICLVISPVVLCSLLAVLQLVINNAFNTRDNNCGCKCLECEVGPNDSPSDAWWGMDLPGAVGDWHKASDGSPCPMRTPGSMCRAWDDNECGIQYSEGGQAGFCAIKNPATWPSMLMLPSKTNLTAEEENESAEFDKGGEPDDVARILVTGGQDSGLYDHLLYPFPAGPRPALVPEVAWVAQSLSKMALGTTQEGLIVYQYDPAYLDNEVYVLNGNCSSEAAQAVNLTAFSETTGMDFKCLNASADTRPSSDALEADLFCTFRGAKCEKRGSFVGGYDFRDSAPKGGLKVENLAGGRQFLFRRPWGAACERAAQPDGEHGLAVLRPVISRAGLWRVLGGCAGDAQGPEPADPLLLVPSGGHLLHVAPAVHAADRHGHPGR